MLKYRLANLRGPTSTQNDTIEQPLSEKSRLSTTHQEPPKKKRKRDDIPMIYGLRREKLGFATEVQTAFSIYSILTGSHCSYILYIVKIITYL
jgi:hypothetical protein